MKMTYYRLMCGYESLWVPCSIIWSVHKHLAISYESAKYWLIQCYKCTIHCRAGFNFVALKPMKILLRKVSLHQVARSVCDWTLVTWQLNSVHETIFLRKMRRKCLWHFYLVCTGKTCYCEPRQSPASLLYDLCWLVLSVWLISFGREMNNWKLDLFLDVVS